VGLLQAYEKIGQTAKARENYQAAGAVFSMRLGDTNLQVCFFCITSFIATENRELTISRAYNRARYQAAGSCGAYHVCGTRGH